MNTRVIICESRVELNADEDGITVIFNWKSPSVAFSTSSFIHFPGHHGGRNDFMRGDAWYISA